MIKTIKIILLLAIILAAAWLTPALLRNPGLIQVELLGYQVQMTAIAAGLLVAALFFIIWVAYALFKAPKQAVKHIKANVGRKKFARGLLALSEGKWAQAEKLLIQSVKQSPTPELSYMAAARAAVSQHNIEAAEQYLDQAEAVIDNPLTVDLTRCEIWLKTGQADKAMPLLDLILKTYPNNPKAVHLLTQATQESGQWQQLRNILPKAEKLKIINPEQATLLNLQATEARFQTLDSVEHLMALWQGLNKKEQAHYLNQFCQHGIRVGAFQQVTEQIEKSQKTQFSNLLVDFWSALPHNLNHRLKVAEKWLSQHPSNPHVLMCNAKLQMAKKQWDQAESLLLKNMAIANSSESSKETNQLLGQVYQEQQQPEKALTHYRLATKNSQAITVIDESSN